MVFLDSNIFIIDRFFQRDSVYTDNKKFLRLVEQAGTKAAVPFYTFLEICSVASFNLSQEELEAWLYSFAAVYPVMVLDPYPGTKGELPDVGAYLLEIGEYLTRKMTLGDAVFLREAEGYGAEAIITWNKKHFAGRTKIKVLTPPEYQECREHFGK
jgi:predicted nucleic acid-binding protein